MTTPATPEPGDQASNPSNSALPATAVPPDQRPQEAKSGLSGGAKVGIGCGLGCLGMLVVLVIVGVVLTNWVTGIIDEFESDLTEKGLVQGATGQQLVITEPPTEPTYYKAQMVTINLTEPVTVELGVLAQQVEFVQGSFSENVYCRAQVVILNPGATFSKDVDVKCQVIQDRGATVEGEITGSWQARQ